MKIAATVFLFLIALSTYSTNLDEYWGKYQSIDPENGVSFILNRQGVSNLSVNGTVIDPSTLTYDYLGIREGMLHFRIEFNDGKEFSVIRLFILNFNREIVLTIGYYLRYQVDDAGDPTLLKVQALELCFIPIPDC